MRLGTYLANANFIKLLGGYYRKRGQISGGTCPCAPYGHDASAVDRFLEISPMAVLNLHTWRQQENLLTHTHVGMHSHRQAVCSVHTHILPQPPVFNVAGPSTMALWVLIKITMSYPVLAPVHHQYLLIYKTFKTEITYLHK